MWSLIRGLFGWLWAVNGRSSCMFAGEIAALRPVHHLQGLCRGRRHPNSALPAATQSQDDPELRHLRSIEDFEPLLQSVCAGPQPQLQGGGAVRSSYHVTPDPVARDRALGVLCPELLGKGRCGVVWCGVVWCGVVWCGVVWCGVVWCGVVWCGVVWCGVVWCGVVWCGVVWCGVVWYGVVWCGVVWCAEGAVTRRQWPGCLPTGTGKRAGLCVWRARCVEVCCGIAGPVHSRTRPALLCRRLCAVTQGLIGPLHPACRAAPSVPSVWCRTAWCCALHCTVCALLHCCCGQRAV